MMLVTVVAVKMQKLLSEFNTNILNTVTNVQSYNLGILLGCKITCWAKSRRKLPKSEHSSAACILGLVIFAILPWICSVLKTAIRGHGPFSDCRTILKGGVVIKHYVLTVEKYIRVTKRNGLPCGKV